MSLPAVQPPTHYLWPSTKKVNETSVNIMYYTGKYVSGVDVCCNKLKSLYQENLSVNGIFKEALSVLMLCAPVFIFTSGSSAS